MSVGRLFGRLATRRQADPGARARRLAQAFETCGNGWFWETDARGCLTYISSTFVQALGVDPKSLLGQPLADLAAADASSLEPGIDTRALGFHLQAQLPFFEVTVPVRFPVGIHWWSLSGMPIFGKRRRFDGFTGVGTDLTDVRRSEDRAARLARFDPLTGLANRMTIRETLEEALRSQGKSGHDCALLLLDLDQFKSVNDTLGHPVGDRLLEQVADRLRTLVGNDGRVGRLGGDEFAIVVHGECSRQALSALAARVIDYLSAPYSIDGHRIVVGASVGIAVGSHDGQSVDALMRNADLALYAAKGDGRGKHRFYRAAMHRDAQERRQLESDLRAAIGNGGLSLVFQPIVATDSERLAGFEALARWHHPTLGDVPPSKFIPIAEEAGLIEAIGEWVLRSACAAAAAWPDHVSIAVNLSPLQFGNPELAALVVNALAQSGLAANRLEFEITEGVFLQENLATRTTLQQLAALGIGLTLDDFGTGYSSLAYLNRAPFRKLKIDRTFVSGAAAGDGQNAAIVRTIVALADSLGLATTAEGVETFDDLDVIRALGCTQVQGFIFGKGVDVGEASRLAASSEPLSPEGRKATRARRRAALRMVDVLHEGLLKRAVLRNLSPSGAMFDADWSPQVGERLYPQLKDGIQHSGVVRWVHGGRFGVLFDDNYVEPEIAERQPRAFDGGKRAA
jgi:diguanylate cyclase (GGDEF)-like protein